MRQIEEIDIEYPCRELRFSRSGKSLAVLSTDNVIRIWKLDTSAKIATVQPHTLVLDFVWSNCGLLAAAFAIIVPFSHLMGYISLLEALALWLIELPIYLFFLGLPGGYYRHLKNKSSSV